MRITLDTNVLIAAFISQGHCHELLEHCVRHHEVVLSDFILEELREKFLEKFDMDPGDVADTEALLRSRAEVVTPVPLEEPVSRDPDDDWVLATALTGGSTCLMTGDKDLLVLEMHAAIDMVSPSDFWEYEARSS